ncbi:hypothetical protein GOODEAATRI_029217, partial [Goodea atripinnis]
GISYQYNRLLFGCGDGVVAAALCRDENPLLDDLLLLARSREEAVVQTKALAAHLTVLGFSIN